MSRDDFNLSNKSFLAVRDMLFKPLRVSIGNPRFDVVWERSSKKCSLSGGNGVLRYVW